MLGSPDGDKRLPDPMSFEEIEHELKTPLTSIRSLSEIMRDYPELSPAERQAFLEGVLHENERLARTVDRLLGSPLLRQGIR